MNLNFHHRDIINDISHHKPTHRYDPIDLVQIFSCLFLFHFTSWRCVSHNKFNDTTKFQITIKQLRIVSIDLFRDNQNLTDAEKAKKKENPTVDGQLDSSVDKGLNQGTTVSAVPTSFLLGGI